MQHLRVKFGGIWRFELGFFICFFCFNLLKKSGLIFKRPVATLRCHPPEAYAMQFHRQFTGCNSVSAERQRVTGTQHTCNI